MATLQELIDQYATELPDYLRVKPQDEASRALASIDPAATPAIPPETKDTEKTTIRKSISLKELQSDYQKKSNEAQKAYDEFVSKRESAIGEKKPSSSLVLEPTPDPYASAMANIQAAKKSAMPEKPESNMLAEALITFLPALLGAGAGAAFGGPGGAGAGLAGGAMAGTSAVSKMKEEQQKAVDAQRKVGLDYLDNVTKFELLKAKQAEERAMIPEKARLFASQKFAEENIKREYDPVRAMLSYNPELENLKQARKDKEMADKALKQGLLQGTVTTEKGTAVGTGKAGKPAPSEAKMEWDKLPPPLKTQATNISTGIAEVKKAYNSIKPTMDAIKKLDPKKDMVQIRALGDQLFKALNTAATNRSDAVGQEEAARIGGLNQFKIFNISRPGSMFGTDTNEYLRMVQTIQSGLKKRIGLLEKNMEDIYAQGGAKYYGAVPTEAAGPTIQSVYPKMTDQEKIEYKGASEERRKQIILDASKR